MSSQEEFSLPKLETDGHIDLLTGLDAPEIFYRFMEKAISSTGRDPSRAVALMRVRLGLEPLRRSSIEVSNDGLAFRIVQFAKVLQSHTRSDEHLVRIGEVTFLILVTVRDSSKVGAISSRLITALADARFDEALGSESVDGYLPVEKGSASLGIPGTIDQSSHQSSHLSVELDVSGYPMQVSVDGFLHQAGEEMITFLERVGV